MKTKINDICNNIHPLSVKNVIDSCIVFMKNFNEYKKKVEEDLVFDMNE
jgi:hypothetical protein